MERDLIGGKRLAPKAGKGRAGIGERVDANSEPCDPVTAANPDHAERQDDDHAQGFILQQHAEVQQNDDGDERPEEQQELALLDDVGLASFPDQLRHLCHRVVDGQVLQAAVGDQAKEQSEDAKQNADGQQPVAGDAQELDLGKVRKLQIGFAAGSCLGGPCKSSGSPHQCHGNAGRECLSHSAALGPDI